MNNKYEPVIGLEVHVELNTRSKMFCRCSAEYFGKAPNTNTCPICLGLPGAIPLINKEAINKCIQIGLALNCSINKKNYFERKNYFYPDLAKGFQISQLVLPVAVNGSIEVEGDDGKKITVRINRAHQEEDTGKLTHTGAETLIDFNRSGVPLVEIVTEPDFIDSSQIRDYAKKLQQIFRYLGVSNADMEKGDMRLEANVSVRKVEQQNVILGSPDKIRTTPESSKADDSGQARMTVLPPYRVELKNINSFRFMVAAVEYEIKRQIELYEQGREDELKQETRGWNEDKRQTYTQRSKEEAHDYRYFPEPDLPELQLEESRVKSLESSLPRLPWELQKKFEKEYGIKKSDAKILTESKDFALFVESIFDLGKKEGMELRAIANYIINSKIDLIDSSPEQIIDDLKAKKSGVIEDEGELENIAKVVILENSKSVESYKSGKENAIMALIGGVMRKTSGKANASKVKEILEKLLAIT